MTPTSDGVGVRGGGCTSLAEVRLRLGVEGLEGTLKFVVFKAGSPASLTDLLLDLFDRSLDSACEANDRFKFVLEAALAVPFTMCRLAVRAERLSDMISKSADRRRRQPIRK